MYKINDVAKLFNTTRRTLQYYDEKGLLRPNKDTNGYRIYNDEDIKLLSIIMIYKELEIPLEQIKEILKKDNKKEVLEQQKSTLEKRILKYYKTIDLIDEIIKEGEIMTKIKDVYAEEAKEKYGHTNEYKTSQKRWNSYSDAQKKNIMQEGNDILIEASKNMDKDITSKEVQSLVKAYQDHVTKYYYTLTKEIYASLADVYVDDERFKKTFEDIKPGLSKFYSEAVKYYCKK